MKQLDIFEKRFLIVSGKGGVGKSTVCAALALAASRQGKRVLLVEMDEKERISRLFGTPEAGYEGAFVHRNIYARNLKPMNSMDDFVRAQVRSNRIARQIIDSQIYRYFVAAAPGLKEFVTLGKIMLLEEETERNGRLKYDVIILDAPATGHGVAFLRVPFAAAETVKLGWVRKQADRIIELMTDPAKTVLNIVTLPEEMPVNETLEMVQAVNEKLAIPIGYIIINSVLPEVLRKRDMTVLNTMRQRAASGDLRALNRTEEKFTDMLFECYEAAARRRELNKFYISNLKRLLKYEFLEIPFVFAKSFDIHLVEEVAAFMTRSIGKRNRA